MHMQCNYHYVTNVLRGLYITNKKKYNHTIVVYKKCQKFQRMWNLVLYRNIMGNWVLQVKLSFLKDIFKTSN